MTWFIHGVYCVLEPGSLCEDSPKTKFVHGDPGVQAHRLTYRETWQLLARFTRSYRYYPYLCLSHAVSNPWHEGVSVTRMSDWLSSGQAPGFFSGTLVSVKDSMVRADSSVPVMYTCMLTGSPGWTITRAGPTESAEPS